MNPLMLFTDGSVHPPTQTGYGAYLAVTDANTAPAALQASVQLKRFEETSSTQLEVETVIWALREIIPQPVTIYSDSQNIIGLPRRRARFERQNYRSKNNSLLNHAKLYQEFFTLTDQFECTFIKVKGHRRSKEKTRIEQLFTLVDRASRHALRAELAE